MNYRYERKKKRMLFCIRFWIYCFFVQSLCNACGIRFKKEERRASAAAATSTANGAVIEPSHVFSSHQYHHNNPWSNFPHSQTQKMPCLSPASEFRFMDDHDNHQYESDTGISFLSWRLNVTDRPSLVHDFTRWKNIKRLRIFNAPDHIVDHDDDDDDDTDGDDYY